MIARRDLVGLVGAGAVATAAVSLAATGAGAQAAGQNTFDRIRANRRLRVGAVQNSAPWFVRDPATGNWGGHFSAIGAAVAADMEVQIEIVETTWGNAVLDLQSDKIDVMFGLNPTPRRAMAVDFSNAMYESALVVIAKAGFEPRTWADLNRPEVRIAVDVGSSHDQVASRLCPRANIIRFRTMDEAMLAVRTGRADAQCIFWMGAVQAVKRDPSIGHIVVPQPFFGSTSNAAFRREADKTWRDFINTWIGYARGMGLIREAVVQSLTAVNVTEADIPPGITL